MDTATKAQMTFLVAQWLPDLFLLFYMRKRWLSKTNHVSASCQKTSYFSVLHKIFDELNGRFQTLNFVHICEKVHVLVEAFHMSSDLLVTSILASALIS